MKTIWIATANDHKKEEFEQMLPNVQVRTLKDLQPDLLEKLDIEETGKTFEENALIKARALHNLIAQAVIADDSGLAVDALDGMPGIYSSRFMGEETPYAIKNQAIIDAVEGKERSARFICAIAYIDEQGKEHTFRGTMEGEIAKEITGAHGFGYDPIFYFPPFKTTNGNVNAEMKNKYSHRHNALEQFLAFWRASE